MYSEDPLVNHLLHAAHEREELYSKAVEIRRIFMGMLEQSISMDKTDGSCAYASYLSRAVLLQFTLYSCIIRGGDGEGDGGYIDANGKSHGHYWLEVEGVWENYIFDITADQFGGDEVVVMQMHSNQNYIKGNQEIVNFHIEDMAKTLS